MEPGFEDLASGPKAASGPRICAASGVPAARPARRVPRPRTRRSVPSCGRGRDRASARPRPREHGVTATLHAVVAPCIPRIPGARSAARPDAREGGEEPGAHAPRQEEAIGGKATGYEEGIAGSRLAAWTS